MDAMSAGNKTGTHPPSTNFVNECNTHAHKNDITSSITASKKVMVITGKCIKFNVG